MFSMNFFFFFKNNFLEYIFQNLALTKKSRTTKKKLMMRFCQWSTVFWHRTTRFRLDLLEYSLAGVPQLSPEFGDNTGRRRILALVRFRPVLPDFDGGCRRWNWRWDAKIQRPSAVNSTYQQTPISNGGGLLQTCLQESRI